MAEEVSVAINADTAPFAAALLNRFGLRNVAVSTMSVVTASLLLSLGMSKIWQLILLWGVVPAARRVSDRRRHRRRRDPVGSPRTHGG